jgi:hypothetical protein
MLYEVVRIVRAGSLEYGAHVKSASGSVSVFVHALRVMPHQMMSIAGVVLLGGVLIALVLTTVFSPRRRPDWCLLTIVIVALATLEMSVQTDLYESRYYLPSIALLAIGAARSVGVLPTHYLRAIIAVACGLTLVSAAYAHRQVRSWAEADEQGVVLVDGLRAATHGGCGLTITGVDYERTRSIAALVGYRRGHVDCDGSARQVLLGPSTNLTPQAACGKASAKTVGTWPFLDSDRVVLVRCSSG